MKFSLIIFCACLLFGSLSLNAQSTVSPGVKIAENIAGKMKDTLGLSNSQRDSIYAINIALHEKKMAAWQQNLASDALRRQLQIIENTRDSLYQRILNEPQFFLYRQKKNRLIAN